MEISNKESTEKQIWEKFKENLGNCKDPAKAIIIAKETISDALKKRGKDTKSNTGIAKIYQAVEQCNDTQDKLKILATGRDLNNNKLTGYGTKWKNEIKNKFQKLLDNENESKKNPPTNNSSNSSSPLYNKLVSFFDCKGAVTDENTLNAQIELIKNSKSKEQIKDAINKNQIAFFNVNIKERTKDLINDSDKFKAFLKTIDDQLDLIQNKPISYFEHFKFGSYSVYNKYMNDYATIFSNAFGVTKDDFLKNILNKSNIYFKNLLVVSYCNKKATQIK